MTGENATTLTCLLLIPNYGGPCHQALTNKGEGGGGLGAALSE